MRFSAIAAHTFSRRILVLATIAVAWSPRAAAQTDAVPRDPNAAQLITSDIANFWHAYDRAVATRDSAERSRAYLDLYIRPGSPGLHAWVRSRLTSGPALRELLIAKGWSRERLQQASTVPLTGEERARLVRDSAGTGDLLAAMNLDAAVQHRPRFFAAIRANTLAIDTARAVKDSIRVYYRRLTALYPDAVFPPAYFVIGQLTSGGTTSDAGQLLGAELHGADASTPMDELSDWERSVMGRVDGLPGIVAHELIHIQQAHARDGRNNVEQQSKRTLLAQSLDEGCATFVGGLLVGADQSTDASRYGLAHEHDLWLEFRREMDSTDASNWLYQGNRAKDRPADLGYFMGARICGAFYAKAGDKREAVREILVMRNPADFVTRSGYSP